MVRAGVQVRAVVRVVRPLDLEQTTRARARLAPSSSPGAGRELDARASSAQLLTARTTVSKDRSRQFMHSIFRYFEDIELRF